MALTWWGLLALILRRRKDPLELMGIFALDRIIRADFVWYVGIVEQALRFDSTGRD